MVRKILQTPLAPGLTLEQIAPAERLNEVEFYFPIARLEAQALSAIFGELPASLGRIHFEPQRGFIKGFIDLVVNHRGRFYIVDWKSNWLGTDAAAYTSEAMRAEMTRHHYVLQYHLYALALHRFLSVRMPLRLRAALRLAFSTCSCRRGSRLSPPWIFSDRPEQSADRQARCAIRGGHEPSAIAWKARPAKLLRFSPPAGADESDPRRSIGISRG
jgi:hypothetical protein